MKPGPHPRRRGVCVLRAHAASSMRRYSLERGRKKYYIYSMYSVCFRSRRRGRARRRRVTRVMSVSPVTRTASSDSPPISFMFRIPPRAPTRDRSRGAVTDFPRSATAASIDDTIITCTTNARETEFARRVRMYNKTTFVYARAAFAE